MKKFTDFDKEYAKRIAKTYKWMARDSDNELWVYAAKPHKVIANHIVVWIETSAPYAGVGTELVPTALFNSVQCTDEEPTLISDIYSPHSVSTN